MKKETKIKEFPVIDMKETNLYALSVLFRLPIDELLCGNKKIFWVRKTIRHNAEVCRIILKKFVKIMWHDHIYCYTTGSMTNGESSCKIISIR